MQISRLLAIPGVVAIQRLVDVIRVQTAMPGAPGRLEIKLYENPDGLFEAVPSHLPQLPRLAKPAPLRPGVPARPAPTRVAPRAFDPFAAIAEPHRSPEAAVEETIRLLARLVERGPSQPWEPNPRY